MFSFARSDLDELTPSRVQNHSYYNNSSIKNTKPAQRNVGKPYVEDEGKFTRNKNTVMYQRCGGNSGTEPRRNVSLDKPGQML